MRAPTHGDIPLRLTALAAGLSLALLAGCSTQSVVTSPPNTSSPSPARVTPQPGSPPWASAVLNEVSGGLNRDPEPSFQNGVQVTGLFDTAGAAAFDRGGLSQLTADGLSAAYARHWQTAGHDTSLTVVVYAFVLPSGAARYAPTLAGLRQTQLGGPETVLAAKPPIWEISTPDRSTQETFIRAVGPYVVEVITTGAEEEYGPERLNSQVSALVTG